MAARQRAFSPPCAIGPARRMRNRVSSSQRIHSTVVGAAVAGLVVEVVAAREEEAEEERRAAVPPAAAEARAERRVGLRQSRAGVATIQ